jgi:hypothetical protein
MRVVADARALTPLPAAVVVVGEVVRLRRELGAAGSDAAA